MREAVRSGRRAGFYMTENSFIDDYARDVGTTGVAVYHVLERHANCDTHSTWIGTAKMAKLLNVDQRTIQRTIKKLESLRLIRIVRSENMTTFYIMPVPPRGKTTTSPLFDEMPGPLSNVHDTEVAIPTHESRATTFASPTTTPVSRKATFMSQTNDIPVALYKEEQDLLNKTQEQDSFNKSCENKNTEVKIAAKRILNTLSLPATSLHAAIAAVELKAGGTDLSMDAVVQEISTEAHLAYRRRVSAEEFLAGFLAQTLAKRILEEVHLPPTPHFVTTVAAALKVEAKDKSLGLEETAMLIAAAAVEDRRRGIEPDKFYFENCKWRNSGRTGKGQQQFDRIKRARDEAHAIIDAQMDH